MSSRCFLFLRTKTQKTSYIYIYRLLNERPGITPTVWKDQQRKKQQEHNQTNAPHVEAKLAPSPALGPVLLVRFPDALGLKLSGSPTQIALSVVELAKTPKPIGLMLEHVRDAPNHPGVCHRKSTSS